MVTLAMIAMTKKPTKKTLSKFNHVHDDHDDHCSATDFENDKSDFPSSTLQFACNQCVLRSLRSCCRIGSKVSLSNAILSNVSISV